jgi:hypothetical protein
MLSPGNDNNVNGLPIWPVNPPASKAPWLTVPTVRQLSLLEQAVNACTYDWDRLRKIGLGHASVQVTWVNAEYLYAGHIGTVSLEKARTSETASPTSTCSTRSTRTRRPTAARAFTWRRSSACWA